MAYLHTEEGRQSPVLPSAEVGRLVIDPDTRLLTLNELMARTLATQRISGIWEDQTEGEERAGFEAINRRAGVMINDILMDAASIVPVTFNGFALKARLLTCVYGKEETNFSDGEEALYRSLIGQMLSAHKLSRIHDNAEDLEFLANAENKLAVAS